MKKLSILLCVVLVVGLWSCTPIKQDDVTIKSVENITPIGGSKFGVSLLVENKSRKDIHVEEAKFFVSQGSDPLIDVMLVEGFVIPRNGTHAVEMTLAYSLSNQLALMGLMMSVIDDPSRLDGILVTGTVKARVGAIRKTIQIPPMTYQELVKMLEEMDVKGLNSFI